MTNTVVKSAGSKDYNILHFNWFLVDWCNYNCSYCCTAETMRETFSKQDSSSKYKLALEILKRVDPEFEVDLFGGEPTLHSNIEYILNELSGIPNCRRIEIKTNLSRPLLFLKELAEVDKVEICAAYHPEHHNRAFIDKCIALKDTNFYCFICLTDQEEYWENTLQLIQELDEHGVRYQFNILYSTSSRTIAYSDKFFKVFGPYLKNEGPLYDIEFDGEEPSKVTAYDLHLQGLNSYTGYKCRAQMYTIDINGQIRNSCSSKDAPILFKKDIVNRTIVCPVKMCNCDYMFSFYKERRVKS